METTKTLNFLLFLILMVTSAPFATEAAVSCNQVVNYLLPCVSYVSNGGQPAINCCNNIRILYTQSATTSDRQGVCKCLKRVVNGIPYTPRNLALAAGLPKACKVDLPYQISPSTNCDSVR